MEEVAVRGAELLKKGLSVLHESLADYMLVNPGCTLREMGAHFGYTGPWLCTVMSTDLFRAYMAKRRGGIETQVMLDLPAKLHAAAHMATEKIIAVLEKTEDPDLVVDCFDKILHRYGYAPNAKTGAQAAVVNNTQNNTFLISKDDLGEARSLLVAAHSNPSTRQLPVVVEQVPDDQ